MESLLQDLRYAARMLRSNPGFTAVAVLTLALGIGANTAIFSVVNAVLLRSLPYKDPDRLVVAAETVGGRPMPVSYPNYLDWRAQNQVFEDLAAYAADDFNLTGIEQAQRISGEIVTDNYFSLLGIAAAKGRTFLPEENRMPRAHPVAMVSHGCWQRRFGGNPNLIGHILKLNEAEYTIIGIMPEGFNGFSGEAEVWAPMMMRSALYPQTARFDFLNSRDIHWHRVLGRLKPGVTMRRAQSDLETIAARIARDYPQANEGRGARVIAAKEEVTGNLHPPLLLLLGAVGFVLLIACANVANLLLVRVAARNKEIAIRAALGAGRWRVMRQLLTESVLLALLGGALGLLLAVWGLDLLVSILPITLPRFATVHLNPAVLEFTSLMSIITGVGLGLVPALQASKLNLNETLNEASKASSGVRTCPVGGALVIAEIALALVLMIGAGLMIRSLQRMLTDDPGFRPDHLAMMRFDVPNKKYQGERRAMLGQQLVDRIETLPGVESAGLTFVDPFLWSGINLAYTIEGRAPVSPSERDTVYYHNVSPNYFHTMGIPFTGGRDFTVNDNKQSLPVMIVSSSFARRYWPGQDPIGKRVKFGPENSTAPWMTVIGVAGDLKFRGLRQDPNAEPVMYTPLLQNDVIVSLSLLVRTKTDPASLIETLRKEIQSFDLDLPVYSVATMEKRLNDQAAETRSYARLLGLFAALAMLLSTIGIYGVMAYSVGQRTHEIGIRIALGAETSDILVMVIRRGLVLASIGAAIGLIGTLWLTETISSLLYGVTATDPLTFVALSFLFIAVSLLACFLPARRAAKVDPMVALRYE